MEGLRRGQARETVADVEVDVILPGPWAVYGAMMGDDVRYGLNLLTFIKHLLFSMHCSNGFLYWLSSLLQQPHEVSINMSPILQIHKEIKYLS